jgi:hypothetical protein
MHTEFHMGPTEADIRQMREAFGSDEIFLEFTEERKRELFEGVLETKQVMELYDDVAEGNETTKRTRYALKLQSSLERLIEILNEDEGSAHLLQAMAKMRESRGLSSPEIAGLAACRTEVWNFAAGLFFGCARSFFHLNGR